MAPLKAYFDASQGRGIYAVAGFVGQDEDWEELASRWSEGLKTFGLSDFHLADIVYQMGHEKGALCILHFSKIIGRSKLRGVGASCEIAHWENRNTGYSNPYHFTFSLALNILREETKLELENKPIALTLDDDVQPHDITEAVFAAYQKESPETFESLTIGNRREYQPIQYADLAVGALRKEWLEGLMSHKQRAIRQFFGAIGSHARFTHFSAETERMAAEANGSILREP